MDPTTIQMMISFCIGIFSGTLAGMFGIGGATVAIPLMRLLLGLDAHVIIGTALPLTIPAALAGAITYHLNGKGLLKFKTIAVCGAVGAVASVLGAFSTEYFSSAILMGALGALLLYLAFMSYKKGGVAEGAEAFPEGEKLARSAMIGAFAGFVSGFLGIGGGVILVPLLIHFRKIPYRQAVASSLAILAIYAIPGAVAHYAIGDFDFPIFAGMFFGAAIGGWQGAKLSKGVSEPTLRKGLSVLLAILGIVLIANEAYIALFS
jgi:uncharacterized membrane protein YfcA